VTLVTTATCSPSCSTPPTSLAKDGIKADVLHYPSVKPFDAATLVASGRKTGGVVTIEKPEHSRRFSAGRFARSSPSSIP